MKGILKKFISGLVFGFGFSIAAVIVVYIAITINMPSDSEIISTYEADNTWYDLSITEKIDKCSAVALIRFKEESDGLRSAHVENIYKKDPSVTLDIEIGQRVEKFDFYTSGAGRDRDGLLVFYSGNPVKQRDTGYLYDSRLIGAGDMPLSVFLKKFEQSKSGDLNTQSSIPRDSFDEIEDFEEFNSLTLEEKIENATAILLTEYTVTKKGKLKNQVVEILKKEPGVDLYYEVGDNYKILSPPKIDEHNAHAGFVVFMDDNPATMRYAVAYDEKGMRGLENISLALLKQKCDL